MANYNEDLQTIWRPDLQRPSITYSGTTFLYKISTTKIQEVILNEVKKHPSARNFEFTYTFKTKYLGDTIIWHSTTIVLKSVKDGDKWPIKVEKIETGTDDYSQLVLIKYFDGLTANSFYNGQSTSVQEQEILEDNTDYYIVRRHPNVCVSENGQSTHYYTDQSDNRLIGVLPLQYPIKAYFTTKQGNKSEVTTVAEHETGLIGFERSIDTLRQKYPIDQPHEIARLDDIITESISTKDLLWRSYCKNLKLFEDSWATYGGYYYRWHNIGLLANNQDNFPLGWKRKDGISDDIFVDTSLPWEQRYELDMTNVPYNKTMTRSIPLTSEAGKQEIVNNHSSRQDVVQTCASYAATLTNYWSLAYSAATALGIYLPNNWDCCDILAQSAQYSLFYLSWLPLMFQDYDRGTKSYTTHDSFLHGPSNIEADNATIVINDTWMPTHIKSQRAAFYRFKALDDNKLYYAAALPQIGDTADSYSLLLGLDEPLRAVNGDTLETDTDFKLSNVFRYWDAATPAGSYNNLYHLYANRSSYTEDEYYYMSATDRQYSVEQLLLGWVNGAVTKNEIDTIPLNSAGLQYAKDSLNQYMTRYLANAQQYNDNRYYILMQKHDNIWRQLYFNYPGIFRESVYTNSDAGTSQELYNAAKTQLDALSRPAVSYSMTGMDIYMNDRAYNPLRIQLGDQVRIDYQEDVTRNDELYKALQEPLYITGISRTLRSDGDCQFTVLASKATDIMFRRFAKLLNFAK